MLVDLDGSSGIKVNGENVRELLDAIREVAEWHSGTSRDDLRASVFEAISIRMRSCLVPTFGKIWWVHNGRLAQRIQLVSPVHKI